MRDLERQVAFGPRVPGTKAHTACRDWLVAELKPLADEVRVQPFTHRRVFDPVAWRAALDLPADTPVPHAIKSRTANIFQMSNIVATFKGEDGRPPDLLLCAHWDSRPTADREEKPENRLKPIPGANDGASGVAILLELARLFHEKRPPRGIIIALFDGEDLGPGLKDMLLGAEHYAKNPIPVKPKEGILLDMVGDRNLAIPRETYSESANKPLLDSIYAAAARHGHADAFPNRPGQTIQDDHVPLILAGINTVDLIDFDYPHWHTLGDTPDKCDPKSLEIVGRAVAEVVYARR